jgi:hypothetical protein
VCVLYTEIKISALFEKVVRFITKLNLALLLGHPRICRRNALPPASTQNIKAGASS